MSARLPCCLEPMCENVQFREVPRFSPASSRLNRLTTVASKARGMRRFVSTLEERNSVVEKGDSSTGLTRS